MKALWGSGAILALMVVLLCLHANYLRDRLSPLDAILREAESAVMREDWVGAAECVATVEARLEAEKVYFHIFLSHHAIEDVQMSLLELEGFMRSEEPGPYFSSSGKLRYQIQHLYELESPGSWNLL